MMYPTFHYHQRHRGQGDPLRANRLLTWFWIFLLTASLLSTWN